MKQQRPSRTKTGGTGALSRRGIPGAQMSTGRVAKRPKSLDFSLHVAAEETVKRERHNLVDKVGSVQVVTERQQVASALRRADNGRVRACREGRNLRLALDVLPRGDENGAGEPEDTLVARHTVVPLNQVGLIHLALGEAATVGEVRGRHRGDAELISSTEAPEKLVLRLPPEAEAIRRIADGVPVEDRRERRRVRDGVREDEVAVAVQGKDARAADVERGSAALNRVAVMGEHAARENDHGLVARERAAVGEVGLALGLARNREEAGHVGDRSGKVTGGADERVTKGLMNTLADVGKLRHCRRFLWLATVFFKGGRPFEGLVPLCQDLNFGYEERADSDPKPTLYPEM